jgi:hypothetical protein
MIILPHHLQLLPVQPGEHQPFLIFRPMLLGQCQPNIFQEDTRLIIDYPSVYEKVF